MNRKAFTLIELLVVILIIGILAAVALPQYQKAVHKSRYATLKNLVTSIYQAEQIYYMANAEYTNDFQALDVDIGGRPSSANYRVFPWGVCVIELGPKYTYCKNNTINMSYVLTFKNQRSCVAYGADTHALNHQICKQETDQTTSFNGAGWYRYP